jgi:ribosomal protein L40E
MSKYDHKWIKEGTWRKFAIPYEMDGRARCYDIVGSYEEFNGGFKPAHCRTKVYRSELEAQRAVISHQISKHEKEIRDLRKELDRLSKFQACGQCRQTIAADATSCEKCGATDIES